MLLTAREKINDNFKSRLFAIKTLDKIPTREKTPKVAIEQIQEVATNPTKHKKSKLKLQQEFMNDVTADKKDINDEILWNYFKNQNPSFLAKYLIRDKKANNEQLVNNVSVGLIDLGNGIKRKKILKMKIQIK